MSDRFQPISMEQLTDWIFDELDAKDSIFGVPRAVFFTPRADDRFRRQVYGQLLETPVGVAAGPHTQMAQNIIVSWLVGARFIELKTIQTLDELDVNKPCIDVTDEGYNVEWSQELKVHQSFDEYLRAWVLIHTLHRALGFPGEGPGVLFNMSVGYDLAGIHQPNVQWYLDTMADASAYLPAYVDIVARRSPAIGDVDIPSRLSDTITLSTMHGCPPDEIESISRYLLTERGLHTSVKCNPTLLGPEGVRGIVNDDLGFVDVPIPDEAFGHDLRYEDAVPMFGRLREVAADRGLEFGLKLTNTLEVENWRTVFADDATMYMSGRALHPVTVNLAARLSEEFEGELLLSFAGGADAFNVTELLAGGMSTVTVCSDLLKTGGYLRLAQYTENTAAAMEELGASDLDDLVVRSALARDEGLDPSDVRACALANLRAYAAATRTDRRYRKETFRTDRSKTSRALELFDCIKAPCVDECPVDQKVPQYMDAVRGGDFAEAVRLTREDNPLPSILGQVCDHLCENTCIRTHLDEPLAIRHVKRFIMEHEPEPVLFPQKAPSGARVAVIGAGPAGLSAAQALAYAGFAVTVFEAHDYPGGMVGGAIPEYRLPQEKIDQDIAVLEALGVEFRFGQAAGVAFTLADLRADDYAAVFVAVGAQRAKTLGMPGEDAEGVMDALRFLRSVREGEPVPIGARVGVVGAGDTAMDAVRSALRVGAEEASLIYRRSVDQMPADPEEIHACREEGVSIVEMATPQALHVEDGRLVGLVCTRTEYRGDRDATGRKIPHEVEGSEFELELDTLILAISQHSVLDFFDDEVPMLTPAGYVETDPLTFETSLPGVYAGGDVSGAGPASIVKAAAEGKAVAAAIIAAHGEAPATSDAETPPVDLPAMVMRRARREYRVPVASSPLESRGGFEQTVLGYTQEQAVAEADRCLDCHTICSLCVGVCPNMALITYESEPFRAALPELRVEGGEVTTGEKHAYRAEQRLQIAVLTDFCNECGNCTTACPTSGDPYRDKPRMYLDRAEFEAQADNAFMLLDSATIEGRYEAATHRLSVNGAVEYEGPAVRATLETDTLAVVEAAAIGPGVAADVSLVPAADLYVLWRGLTASMPHLPAAAPSGTRVPAPESR